MFSQTTKTFQLLCLIVCLFAEIAERIWSFVDDLTIQWDHVTFLVMQYQRKSEK